MSERQRIEAAQARHIIRLRRLQELSQKIGASLSTDEVLGFVVESVQELLDVPFVSLALVEGADLVRHVEANRAGPRDEEALQKGQGFTGRVVETKELVYIEDIREEPLYPNREWARRFGLGSYMGFPVTVGEKVIGVLNCIAQGVREFTENDVFLLTTLAHSASIAIQNAERHRQLEEALEQVKRSKEIANRVEKLSSLAVLAEGAAHELLNPANIISLHAQRMQWENEEGSPGYKTAEVILRNVSRITRICEALRQFSKDRTPAQEPLDPNGLVREVMAPLESELRLQNIDAERKPGKVSRRVMGDPSELRSALFHLVRNAMDAMPQGGKLNVTTREVEEEGRIWWEARVSDTGGGIPASILPRIFDPFFTTKSPDKGSGLGLSVTHGIVERHGGKLWAESAHGKGATFILRLPAADE